MKRQRTESPLSPLTELEGGSGIEDVGQGGDDDGEYCEPGPSKPRAKKTKSKSKPRPKPDSDEVSKEQTPGEWRCFYEWNGESCRKRCKSMRDRDRHLDIHNYPLYWCPNPECSKSSTREDDITRHVKLSLAGAKSCGRWARAKAQMSHPSYWRTCEYWKFGLPERRTDPLYDVMLRIRANPPTPCADCAERRRRGIHFKKEDSRGQSSKPPKVSCSTSVSQLQ